MAFDNPQTIGYPFDNMDFGAAAGNTTYRIAGPAGKQGRLKSVCVATAEAFACDATNAQVLVGTASDTNAYAELNIADGTIINTAFNDKDDTDAIISEDIPADSCVLVTLVEGTDGTAVTGQGSPLVVIDWF